MFSLPSNLIRYSIRRYKNNNIRLISNPVTQSQETEQGKKENIIIKKITELNEWYVKFTGLDEIKRLQDRVILTQEKLEVAQEERRSVGQQLVQIRKKSSELQEQLHSTNRWENVQRFLDLTKEETEVLKLEKELSAQFEVLDKAEREIFTTLSNAVRDSHEKEKAQGEYTKYWGIILSIIGTIVGAVVSTIISTIRNKQIVNGISQGVEQKFNEIVRIINIDRNEEHIQTLVSQVVNDNNKSSKVIVEKLSDTQKQLNEILKLNNVKYLLPIDKIGQHDPVLNLNDFMTTQINLLEEHQTEIKKLVNNKSWNILWVNGVNWYLVGGLLLFAIISNSR